MATYYWCRECCKLIAQGQPYVGTGVTVNDHHIGYGLFHYHTECIDAMPEEKRKEVGKIKSDYFKESDLKLHIHFIRVIDLEDLINEVSSNGEGSSLSIVRNWVDTMKANR